MTLGDPPRTTITSDPYGAIYPIYPQNNNIHVDKTWNSTNINIETEETDSQSLIVEVCDEIKEMLLEKNRKYGDSALNPSRIFSRSDAVEQIKVRIDDKLTRLKNMQEDEDEDVVVDLMGYLVLLLVAQRKDDPAPEFNMAEFIQKLEKGQFPPYIIDPGQPYTTPWPQYPYGGHSYTINHYEDGHNLESAIQDAVQTASLSRS